MIISRLLARKRIAAKVPPSFKAAWLPVAADIIIIALVLAMIWQPALTFIYVMELSLPVTIIVLMVLIYAPLQIVIIVSTIWAVRSRWEEKETK